MTALTLARPSRLAPLIADLLAAETQVLIAMAAGAAALAPLDAAASVFGRLPEAFKDARDLLSEQNDPFYPARQARALRARSVSVLLEAAGVAYGAPGVPVTITDSDLPDTLCEPDVDSALRRHWASEEPRYDLVAVGDYLEQTFGGEDDGRSLGAQRAEQELRDALRHVKHDHPAPRPYSGAVVTAYSEVDYRKQRTYRYNDRVQRELQQLAQALGLLGFSVETDRFVATVASLYRAPIVSRARYETGSGLRLVTYSDKIVVEMPEHMARALREWCARDATVAA
jgi:hypothetical protein